MSTWQIEDASQRLDEIVAASIADGPQTLSDGSQEMAVLLGIQEWRRLKATSNGPEPECGPKYASVTDWLLAPEPRFDLEDILQSPIRPQFASRPVRFDD
jgi:prevent-host-death family protein